MTGMPLMISNVVKPPWELRSTEHDYNIGIRVVCTPLMYHAAATRDLVNLLVGHMFGQADNKNFKISASLCVKGWCRIGIGPPKYIQTPLWNSCFILRNSCYMNAFMNIFSATLYKHLTHLSA